MKIENVNDVIAFTRKAMDYGYNINCYNGLVEGEEYAGFNINIISPNDKIVIYVSSKNIIITSVQTCGRIEYKYDLTQKDKALLNLLVVDIDEYRANKMQNILDKFFEPEKDSDTNNLNDED